MPATFTPGGNVLDGGLEGFPGRKSARRSHWLASSQWHPTDDVSALFVQASPRIRYPSRRRTNTLVLPNPIPPVPPRRLHQRRGGSSPPNKGCAVPRRGRVA